MEETMLIKLKTSGVDVDSALERFMQKEDLYVRFLKKFNEDKNFGGLRDSIQMKKFNEAFQYGHTLKGVTGNLGLTPLYEKVAVLVDALRNSEEKAYSDTDISQLNHMFQEVEIIYTQIYNIIADQ